MREWEDCQAFRTGRTELKDKRGERDRERERDAGPYILCQCLGWLMRW